MKYNDYPLPTQELIKVLNKEYGKTMQVKNLNVCRVTVLEQQSKLSELYMYLVAQQQCLSGLKRINKNLELKFDTQNHLSILSEMGVETANVKSLNNLKSCFSDYLKCEAEILKILLFLVLLENLNFDKRKLTQILTEQIENFNTIVNI